MKVFFFQAKFSLFFGGFLAKSCVFNLSSGEKREKKRVEGEQKEWRRNEKYETVSGWK